jgi:hypothetical protein
VTARRGLPFVPNESVLVRQSRSSTKASSLPQTGLAHTLYENQEAADAVAQWILELLKTPDGPTTGGELLCAPSERCGDANAGLTDAPSAFVLLAVSSPAATGSMGQQHRGQPRRAYLEGSTSCAADSGLEVAYGLAMDSTERAELIAALHQVTTFAEGLATPNTAARLLNGCGRASWRQPPSACSGTTPKANRRKSSSNQGTATRDLVGRGMDPA